MATPEKSQKSSWTVALVNQTKSDVRDEIDKAVVGNSDLGVRLSHILAQVARLQDEVNSPNLLRCLVYVMSALVHHERFGGLSMADVGRLFEIGKRILQWRGVKAGKSNLAFLHGELHLVMSQIFRREGEPLRSAWEQQLSERMSGATPVGGSPAHQAMALGLRAIRLGHAALAMHSFQDALKAGMAPPQRCRLQVEMVRTLRLCGMRGRAQAECNVFLQSDGLSANERAELQWEENCLALHGPDADLTPLLASVKKGQVHHAESYILEAFIWTRAVSSTEWLKRYPTVKSLARNPNLDFRGAGFLYRAARLLETSYDVDIPLLTRCERLGRVVFERDLLLGVDKELLVLAATARWLVRNHFFPLASLVIATYQGLSRTLSSGSASDTLGLVCDLVNKEWFQSAA